MSTRVAPEKNTNKYSSNKRSQSKQTQNRKILYLYNANTFKRVDVVDYNHNSKQVVV